MKNRLLQTVLKGSQQLFSSKAQKSAKKLKELVLIQSCLGPPWQQSSAMNMYKGQLEVSMIECSVLRFCISNKAVEAAAAAAAAGSGTKIPW